MDAVNTNNMKEHEAMAPVRLIGAQLAYLLGVGWDGIGGYVGDQDGLLMKDLNQCKGANGGCPSRRCTVNTRYGRRGGPVDFEPGGDCATELWTILRHDRVTVTETNECGTVLFTDGMFVLVAADAGYEITCTPDALCWVGH